MKRRRFLYAAGGAMVAARAPSTRQRAEDVPPVELDFQDMTVSYPEDIDIQPQEEQDLVNDLVWRKPGNFDGAGDCDDFASYINAALDRKGYETVCVSGKLWLETEEEDLEGLHMWTEAEIDGDYYLFDINFPYSFVEREDKQAIKQAARDPEILEIEYKPALMFSSSQPVTAYRSEFAESPRLSGLF